MFSAQLHFFSVNQECMLSRLEAAHSNLRPCLFRFPFSFPGKPEMIQNRLVFAPEKGLRIEYIGHFLNASSMRKNQFSLHGSSCPFSFYSTNRP